MAWSTWLWVLVAPLAIVSAIGTVVQALEVARTGLCPAQPTDIPAYPCPVLEYLSTRAFYGWEAIGLFVVGTTWGATVGAGAIIQLLASGWSRAGLALRTLRALGIACLTLVLAVGIFGILAEGVTAIPALGVAIVLARHVRARAGVVPAGVLLLAAITTAACVIAR